MTVKIKIDKNGTVLVIPFIPNRETALYTIFGEQNGEFSAINIDSSDGGIVLENLMGIIDKNGETQFY